MAVKSRKIEENRGALEREVPECDGRIRGGKGRGIGNVQLNLTASDVMDFTAGEWCKHTSVGSLDRTEESWAWYLVEMHDYGVETKRDKTQTKAWS